MIKKLLSSLGFGGVKVNTVVLDKELYSGGYLHGEIHVYGGKSAQSVENISIDLISNSYSDDPTTDFPEREITIAQIKITERFTIKSEEEKIIPFTLHIPFECPMTMNANAIRLNTKVGVYHAVDSSDKDAIIIHNKGIEEKIEKFIKEGYAHSQNSGRVLNKYKQTFELVKMDDKKILTFIYEDDKWVEYIEER